VGYTVIFSLKIGLDGTLFWLFALPILTFVADFSKKIIWWMVFYVCLLLVIFSYLYFSKSLPPVNNWMMIKVKYNNIIDIFFPFLLICYSLDYKHRLTEIKTAQLIHSMDTNNQNKDILIMGNEDYKYHKIYKQIEEYVETKRPYLNPDFKISKMAHDLNINTGYITKSIQKFKKTNFNNFINIYRIENVKKLIQADTTSKYTLEYIYLSSGFKNQSSFNRIFKLQTGIAPSEYYKQFCEENKSEKISQ
jgi:AraC-like DNA-binding protein